ncbi:MAG: outer membrane beta-barrel protein [Clostridium sp.]
MRKSLILSFASLLAMCSLGKEVPTSVPEVKKEVVNEEKVILDDFLIEEEEATTTSDVIEVKDEESSTNLYLRFGGDAYSKYSKGKTKDLGYLFAVEMTRDVTDSFEAGVGTGYQINPKNKDTSIGKYDSVPVYMTFKYDFNLDSQWTPYLKGNLGYAFNLKETAKNKVKDGAYVGAGAGVEYENFFTDVMYQVNFAKVEPENGKKENLDYSRVTLSLGYKFNM